jgi:2-methylcitrate dehydratase PrpD
VTTASGETDTSLPGLVDRFWQINPAEADYAAAEMRCYDAAVAMTLGPTVHVWPAARSVLGTLWPAQPPADRAASGALAATLAACCRITEVDDIHLRSCTTPGSIVIPVTLALATVGLPRRALLRGVVIGYEAVVGASEAIGGAYALQHGVWPTRAVAPVAAAVTAAAAIGLSRDQALAAVALAAGTNITGTMPEPARELGLGYAVLAGLAAAVTAADGVAGDAGLLDRWPGLVSAGARPTSLEPLADASLAVRETCIKPFCAARQSMAATAAVADFAAGETLAADQVLQVEAGVPSAHVAMVSRPRIGSRLDAIASLPYQIALAMHCPAMLDDIDRPPPWPTAGIAPLMEKVRVVPEPDLDAAFPERWGASVRLTTSEGIYAHTMSGVPSERSLTWQSLADKAGRLFDRAQIDPAEASALSEQVRGADLAQLAERLYRRAMLDAQEGSN